MNRDALTLRGKTLGGCFPLTTGIGLLASSFSK